MTLQRRFFLPLVFALAATACNGGTPTLTLDAKGTQFTPTDKPLKEFTGKNSIKGMLKIDGSLPAGSRVAVSIKPVDPKFDFPFASLSEGGIFTKSLDLKADASTVAYEINDLVDGQYRIKATAFVDLKSRLRDPARQALGQGDFAGTYAGDGVSTQDLSKSKVIEVKGGQVVDASFALSKIP